MEEDKEKKPKDQVKITDSKTGIFQENPISGNNVIQSQNETILGQSSQSIDLKNHVHHAHHHHIGHMHHDTDTDEYSRIVLETLPDKAHGKRHHEHIHRPAHTKRRHRITKKRFMKCVDINQLKAVLHAANLNNSRLWKKKFITDNMGLEAFISCRKDLLKIEVIMEALKEGLLDRPDVYDKKEIIPTPTTEIIENFENEKKIADKKLIELEDENLLEYTRRKIDQLGLSLQSDPKDLQPAIENANTVLNKIQAQQKIEAYEKQDVFSSIVKKVHDETDSPEDDWSVTESTTTGSYKSWRREDVKVPKIHTPTLNEDFTNWINEIPYIGIRFIASLIIFGYWMHYFYHGVQSVINDIYAEQLQNNDVWPIHNLKDNVAWAYLWIQFHDWFHFCFTLIAPAIIVGNHTALGVYYGFSIFLDAFINMYSEGHDIVYESNEPTWEKLLIIYSYAIFMCCLVLVFLIMYYTVDNPVRSQREFFLRKTKLLNRTIQAKCLGSFEQRMFAWEWMTNHAKRRELQQLARMYPEIRKVNGHYPLPDKGEIKFNLSKELNLFRIRHSFYDVVMTGGWINLEKYQNKLLGSEESSEEEIRKTVRERLKKKKSLKTEVKIEIPTVKVSVLPTLPDVEKETIIIDANATNDILSPNDLVSDEQHLNQPDGEQETVINTDDPQIKRLSTNSNKRQSVKPGRVSEIKRLSTNSNKRQSVKSGRVSESKTIKNNQDDSKKIP